MPTRLSRPRSAVLRAAPAGLPQRAGSTARARGTAGGAGEVQPGGGAKRPFEFSIRTRYVSGATVTKAVTVSDVDDFLEEGQKREIIEKEGAGGRNRTDMGLLPRDFEYSVQRF